jgi:hypothetical protein
MVQDIHWISLFVCNVASVSRVRRSEDKTRGVNGVTRIRNGEHAMPFPTNTTQEATAPLNLTLCQG